MLYLNRKLGEAIMIGDGVEVRVVDVQGRTVKLGINSPPDVVVLREELYQKVQEENRRAALATTPDLLKSALEKMKR